jgi:3-dehydroquinate dehydratase type II
MKPPGERNIILIGMPGSGKTTVGQLIANSLGREFFDSDAELARRHGAPCAELINTRGEAAFRELETAVLAGLLSGVSRVIATGGGAVLHNSALLRRNSIVVYLTRDIDAIAAGLTPGERPLSTTADDMRRLYSQRRELYESAAHMTIENSAAPETAAAFACEEIRRHLKARVLIINGPNLNLLGSREPGVYGAGTYSELLELISSAASERGIAVSFFQSNHEGAIIDAIQDADGVYDGLVINPGAYTHYSYAIYDALRAITVPAAEVHISDITKREPFRRVSVTAPACVAQIYGEGFPGYVHALDVLLNIISEDAEND